MLWLKSLLIISNLLFLLITMTTTTKKATGKMDFSKEMAVLDAVNQWIYDRAEKEGKSVRFQCYIIEREGEYWTARIPELRHSIGCKVNAAPAESIEGIITLAVTSVSHTFEEMYEALKKKGDTHEEILSKIWQYYKSQCGWFHTAFPNLFDMVIQKIDKQYKNKK